MYRKGFWINNSNKPAPWTSFLTYGWHWQATIFPQLFLSLKTWMLVDAASRTQLLKSLKQNRNAEGLSFELERNVERMLILQHLELSLHLATPNTWILIHNQRLQYRIVSADTIPCFHLNHLTVVSCIVDQRVFSWRMDCFETVALPRVAEPEAMVELLEYIAEANDRDLLICW